MLVREVVALIPGIEVKGNLEANIKGIAYDSRKLQEGYLFVAMKGEKTDGTQFIRESVNRGAIAIATEKALELKSEVAIFKVSDARRFLAEVSHIFFDNPSSKLKLVGITGTNGKTTTSYLVDAIFRQAGLPSCVVGTLGMKLGERAFASEHTTPEAPDLLLFLQQAVMQGCTHGAMEVSSHALALKRVFGTRITVGAFSNLTPEHLDFHHDMESYYQAKRMLFTGEGSNYIELAAINIDDSWGRRLAAEVVCPLLRYGFAAEADVRALETQTRRDGTKVRIRTPEGEIDLASRLVGLPNVYNILTAVSAGLGLGMSLESIQRGIESLEAVPGRMELIRCGQPFSVVVDYAHTEDALRKILETIAQQPHGRVITVFGCGGDRDRRKRPVMGEIAANLSDLVIATSDNPRTEDPQQILNEIEPGLKRGKARYQLVVDRREAIRAALFSAGKGDVVLIAGKGHEEHQILGTGAIPFDDRAVAREMLRDLPGVRGANN